MKTYKYLNETTIAKIDDDGISRMSCTVEHPEYLAWLASPCGNCEGRGAVPTDDFKSVVQCPVCKGMQRNTPEPADIVIPSYAELRIAEYPPITELIDGLVKDDAAQIAAYKAACLAVKAKYPKS